jgi:CRISPR/Cas system-associated protein Cas10 (large subunit of type III CRISPR-Cas system)
MAVDDPVAPVVVVPTPEEEHPPGHHCEHCDEIAVLKEEVEETREAVLDLAEAVDAVADDETEQAHEDVEDALEALFEE